jgi:predicted ArsR family transcriptional regulator
VIRTELPVAALTVLSEDGRRALFEFVRTARRPVSREEAARATGISRKLAAFHLDKLVEAGLLVARYQAAGGVRKVGRTPKVYEPASTGLHVSIPGRQYLALADVLLDAVTAEASGTSARRTALEVARLRGVELGHAERKQHGSDAVPDPVGFAAAFLGRYGFDPSPEGDGVLRLRNCPFDPLCAKSPAVVCGLNQAYIGGLLAGLAIPALHAVLVPHPGECCVELRTSSPS